MKIKILAKSLIILAFSFNVAFAQIPEGLDSGIKKIQKEWAISKYKSQSKNEKIDGYRKCANQAAELVKSYPDYAEGIIWQGICLSSEAELTKLSALGKVKDAKKLFEKAVLINDQALDGSAYTNLAVLYHRVPGWPISFGDKNKAEEYFRKSISVPGNHIDALYFHALLLMDKKDYESALIHLNKALNSPNRNRPLADEMRKKEIAKKIEEVKEELK
jgi:tetratricopeptide (TPR) repeat protein